MVAIQRMEKREHEHLGGILLAILTMELPMKKMKALCWKVKFKLINGLK